MQHTAIDDRIMNYPDPRRASHFIDPSNNLATADELADFLQVSTGFIYKFARQGRIPSIRIGRSVRFDTEAVERALERW